MRRILTKAIELEWLWTLCLLPFAVFATPLRAIPLLLLPCLWLVRRFKGGRLVARTPLDWALVGLLLMALVSLWVTPDLASSFPKVMGLVYGVMVFYVAVGFSGRGHKQVWQSVILLCGSGLAIASVSFLAIEWKNKVVGVQLITSRLPEPLIRLPGASAGFNANEVAGVLLWVLPLMMVLVVTVWRESNQRSYRFILTGACGVVGIVFVLAQSRAAYLGLAVALLFMVLVALRQHRQWVVGLLIGVVVLSFTTVVTGQIEPLLFASSDTEVHQTFSLETIDSRQDIWARAIYGIQDFPVVGMGLNQFRHVVPVLYPLLFVTGEAFDIAHAHNHWLQAGVDFGLPGLVFYGAMWLGLATMLWQCWRKHQGTQLGWLTVGLSASLLAYFVFGLIDAVALGARPGFIFWLLLGIITGLHQINHIHHERELAQDEQ